MIKYGAIVKETTEHITSIASFIALLAYIETWLDNVSNKRTLGIILDKHRWSFDEYVLTDVNYVTVSIQSFGSAGEQHFPTDQMREIINRCRTLIITPEKVDDTSVVFMLTQTHFLIKTFPEAGNNPSDFYPLYTTVGYREQESAVK